MTDRWPPQKPLHLVEGEDEAVYPKCSLWLRALARAVDVAISWALYLAGERVGPQLALLYILFADGILQGQSPGKRLFGIKAVHLPTRTAARSRDSVLRNAPFGLVIILAMMPPPLGLDAFVVGAVVIGGIEAWKVIRDPQGLRLGDVWAQTQVVDGKVMAGAQRDTREAHPTPSPHRFMAAARSTVRRRKSSPQSSFSPAERNTP